MDNHPIPQDVTGFQFKLIGNMTIKQFAYLATGIILSWVILQLPVSIFIKFPLSLFSALFGVGLTFIPISGRPMDAMIGNFIKALIRPTQFVYEKTGGSLYYPASRTSLPLKKQYVNTSTFPFQQKDKLKAYIESQAMPKNKVDEKENNFLMSVSNLAANNLSSQPNIEPVLNITPISPPVSAPNPTASPIDQKPLNIVPPPTLKPLTGFNRSMGLPSIPDSPNLITGITKDARGNALSNILVEVKDKEGNPVRAFKTNEFGRFASATTLINGTYTLEFEDPKGQNKFEKRVINVAGQIIAPIEAISIDTREELRRSLFSAPSGGLNN